MKLIKLQYKIQLFDGERLVWGHAIESDLPVRLAMRQWLSGGWIMDHYDTGRSIGMTCRTRKACIDHGLAMVRTLLDSGEYRAIILQYNRNAKAAGK